MPARVALSADTLFSDVVGLDENWPLQRYDGETVHLKPRVQWAACFWNAANILNGERKDEDLLAFLGPVMQNLGLACELSFKALLFGGGQTAQKVRNYGHSLTDLYRTAEDHVDIVRFLDAVVRSSTPFDLPEVVADRGAEEGFARKETDLKWRMFTGHLDLLNELYDRPLRTRYIKAGAASLPEPYILLVGSGLILNAMAETLGLAAVGAPDAQ